MFEKSRYLRGIRNAGANSGVEDSAHKPPMPSAISTPYQAAANDAGQVPIDVLLNPNGVFDEKARRSSKSRPFAHALWLGLIVSALLWAVIAAVIHYF